MSICRLLKRAPGKRYGFAGDRVCQVIFALAVAYSSADFGAHAQLCEESGYKMLRYTNSAVADVLQQLDNLSMSVQRCECSCAASRHAAYVGWRLTNIRA